MRKDPTEFRQRFALWKNGEKPYEAGLPKYEDGKPNKIDWSVWDNAKTTPYRIPFVESKATILTNAGYATGAKLSTNLLDSIADNADRAGLPLLTALGLAVKESTLGNPTDDRSAWNLSSDIRRAFNNKYPGTELHINYGRPVEADQLINYYKGSLHPGGDKKSTLQQGFEFYKKYPYKYNPGLKNYQKLVDKRGKEVMQSPEVQKWLKERNIKKATGRFNRINPLLDESKFNLPKFAMGTEGELNYSDDVYKNMYFGNDDVPEYLTFVKGGVPEKTVLDWIKRLVREYPNLYALKGPTLPEVVVKPDPNSISTAVLKTYYPWSDDFPVTGHSTLELTHDRDDWESASSAFISAYGNDPWYNFVTDNCSDATRKAIEYSTGKKINPLFFTTPGDVKDFVEKRLGGKSKYMRGGFVETTFNIPTKQARKIVEYSKMLNKKRFLRNKQ